MQSLLNPLKTEYMMKHKRVDADILFEEFEGHICISIVDRDAKEWILCGATGEEDCLKLNPEYFND